VFTKHSVD